MRQEGAYIMNICVVGTGYVGLVTGTCFAERGNKVWCVDIDRTRIEMLNRGEMPIYEIDLEEMVERNAEAGRLFFTTDLAEGMAGADMCFIAVGTPPDEHGRTDMSQVLSVAESIGNTLDKDTFIIIKSTVPVGTNKAVHDKIEKKLQERGVKSEFEVISNPEFLKEGMAIKDCMYPERVVIGHKSEKASELMRELYMPFVDGDGSRIIFMDPLSAEITKYAANAMLALRISFMNEVGQLCDKVGADVTSVKAGISTDKRIGRYFLNAGCGYGGSCFPKDVKSLYHTGNYYGLEMSLVSAADRVNMRQKETLGAMLRERFGEDMEGITVAVLGLAFKPHTDDMREAPSITLIKSLLKHGAAVAAADPIATENAKKIFPKGVKFAETAEEALKDADAAVLVTEWPQFREIDWRKLGRLMKRKIFFDGRNVTDPKMMKEAGFEHYCIGRGMTPKRGCN